jgi:catechol 2,3-dioxygenase-like lactoylglutathione lyase family enzyme
VIKLRSIELQLPDVRSAAAYFTDVWGAALGEGRGSAAYVRGSGDLPYLVGLFESPKRSARSLTFLCDEGEVAELRPRFEASGRPWRSVVSDDPGGGHGLEIELPEGEVFRFLAGTTGVDPLPGRDLPRKLTHIVLSSVDAEASGRFAEDVLGFRVSDRTKGMVFVRCNRSHHSIAFARAGYASLNHIAFEMEDLDGVMRGIGRLRDHGAAPVWGPGRHGPGNNVFAYFIAPFGGIVEFSTASDEVADDHRAGAPEDWTWPPNRIDQWGVSTRANEVIAEAEKTFRFSRAWEPSAAG